MAYSAAFSRYLLLVLLYLRGLGGYLSFIPYHFLEILRLINPSQQKVLCMPGGGLNDLLCTTLYFYKYSLRSSRILYIGSKYSSVGPLEELFVGWPKSIKFINDDYESLFDSSLSFYPPRSRQYIASMSSDLGVFISGSSKDYITFDSSKKYIDSLLVHVGRGGGFGFDLIRHLQLNRPYRDIILKALEKLPDKYESVQVRNSDIQTDWQQLLDYIAKMKSGLPLLVCSDSDLVISHFINSLSSSRQVFSLRTPCMEGSPVPIHYSESKSQFDRNIEMLIDLFAMALSKRLYVAKAAAGISGFPRLALSMHLYQGITRRMLQKV